MKKSHTEKGYTDKRQTNKRQANKILAVGLGIVLLAAWLWTGEKGISEEDKSIYEEAIKLQEQVKELGFSGFCLSDYPVAMYDGTWDYVFDQGKIERRTPVVETFVGTAYPVEDHFEVIVPTLGQFDSLLSMAGGAESMISGSGYGADEQISTVWHEAFHAYQMTDFAILGEKITAEDMQAEMESGGQEVSRITKEVDENASVRSGLESEMELLKKAAASDIDELADLVLEYKECRRRRLKEMSEEAVAEEIRCELTEGTAYYVEASVYQMLAGQTAYEERYLENLNVFEGGRGKYYRTGLAKCLILDRLAPEWKETFDFTKGLDEMIEKYGRP